MHITVSRFDPKALIALLEVSRSGSYVEAALLLGLNHTTVSRQISSLEQAAGEPLLRRSNGAWLLTARGTELAVAAATIEGALGTLDNPSPSPESLSGRIRLAMPVGFGTQVIVPAIARLRERAPGLVVELVSVARGTSGPREGVDIEIVVGRPSVHRAEAVHLCDFALGFFASERYLAERGTPRTLEELSGHPLIYFIESLLDLDELDAARRRLPAMPDSIMANDVSFHIAAAQASAGIALMSCSIGASEALSHPGHLGSRPGSADPAPSHGQGHGRLRRVLPSFEILSSYWLVGRTTTMQHPGVALMLEEIQREAAGQQDALLGLS